MVVIFWVVFAATIFLALLACPRKAAPVLITALLVGLIALGAGDT